MHGRPRRALSPRGWGEWIANVGDKQADHERLLGGQRTAKDIWLEIKLTRTCQHALTRGLADWRDVVYNARYRRRGDAGTLGNIVDRGY